MFASSSTSQAGEPPTAVAVATPAPSLGIDPVRRRRLSLEQMSNMIHQERPA
jgi:hypothetical protein